MFQSMFIILYKGIRKSYRTVCNFFCDFFTAICFNGNGVKYNTFCTNGIPYIVVALGGYMSIGKNFTMNNGISHNPIGMPQPCTFFVDRGCSLTIGDNVGISQSALIAHADITIGNNVKIGGGTCIYTSDFHSLDAAVRASGEDLKYRRSAPVVIGDNAFVGARCLILKGVTIGENSIIGAGSVVTKSVPANQIWAGNPARFIRNIETR